LGISHVLAVDLATFTGWALLKDGKTTFGSEKFVDKTWDGNGARYIKYEAWLNKFDGVELVVYEAVMAHSSVYAGHMYGAYLAEIQKFAQKTGAAYIGLHVGAIKKHWTGKGNAKKEAMMKEAWKRGYNVKDDNQADALAILDLGVESYLDEWA